MAINFLNDKHVVEFIILQSRNILFITSVMIVFTDDYQTWWGPGWEFDFGLKYTKVRDDYMVKKIELILL